jgi:glycerol uptake facilitator-like aquaporin
MSMVLAEFMGTAVLLTFGCGVCANVNLNRLLESWTKSSAPAKRLRPERSLCYDIIHC